MSKKKRKNPATDSEVVALTILSMAEAAHSYSAYLPSFFTIKTLALDDGDGKRDEKIANLRSGYIPAAGFALLIGSIVSVLSKSPLPLLGSVVTSAVMVSLYEQALPENIRLIGGKQTTNNLTLPGCSQPCSQCPRYSACTKRLTYVQLAEVYSA